MNNLTLPPSPNWYCTDIMACAPDNTLMYGSRQDLVVIKDVESSSEPSDVQIIAKAHATRIISVNCNSNWGAPFKYAVTMSEDHIVKVWDIEAMQKKCSHNKHSADSVGVGAVFAGDERVISLTESGEIVVWNIVNNNTNLLESLLGIGKISVTCLSTCPHAHWVCAFGLKNGLVVVADLRGSGKVIYRLRGHAKAVVSLAWCPAPINIFPQKPFNRVVEKPLSSDESKDDAPDKSSSSKRKQIAPVKCAVPWTESFAKEHSNRKNIVPTKNIANIAGILEERQQKLADSCSETKSPKRELEEPRKEFLLASSARESKIYIWRAGTDGTMQAMLQVPPLKAKNKKKIKVSEEKNWIALYWATPTVLLAGGRAAELLLWTLPLPHNSSSIKTIHREHWSVLFSVKASLVCRTGHDFLQNGNISIWTTGMDRKLIRADLASHEILQEYHLLGGAVSCFAGSTASPNILAIGSAEGMIYVMDLSKQHTKNIKLSTFYRLILSEVTALAWHPNSDNLLAFGTAEGRVGILDLLSKGKPPKIVKHHFTKTIHKIDWAPQSMMFVASDGIIAIFDLEDEKSAPQKLVLPDQTLVYTMSWKPDFKYLLVATKSGPLITYDSKTLEPTNTIYNAQKLQSIVWHPEAHGTDPDMLKYCETFASVVKNNEVHVFDLCVKDENKIICQFTNRDAKVNDLTWNPHKPNQLLLVDDTGVAQIYDITLNSIVSTYISPTLDPIAAAYWSPESADFVVIGTTVQKIIIYNSSHYPAINQSDITAQRNKTLKAQTKESSDLVIKVGKPKNHIENLPPLMPKKPLQILPLFCTLREDAKAADELRLLLNLNNCPPNNSPEITVQDVFSPFSSMQKILDLNMATFRKQGKHQNANVLSLLSGDISDTINDAIKNRRVTPWIISIAPMVSPKLWQMACERYLEQLREESQGDPLDIVSFLLVLHRFEEAVRFLMDHEMFREALTLAKVRMGGDSDLANEVIDRWAKHCVAQGNFELAACCFIAVGKREDAASILFRRTNLKILEVASELSEHNPELHKAVMFRLNAFKEQKEKEQALKKQKQVELTSADRENLKQYLIDQENYLNRGQEDAKTRTNGTQNAATSDVEPKTDGVLPQPGNAAAPVRTTSDQIEWGNLQKITNILRPEVALESTEGGLVITSAPAPKGRLKVLKYESSLGNNFVNAEKKRYEILCDAYDLQNVETVQEIIEEEKELKSDCKELTAEFLLETNDSRAKTNDATSLDVEVSEEISCSQQDKVETLQSKTSLETSGNVGDNDSNEKTNVLPLKSLEDKGLLPKIPMETEENLDGADTLHPATSNKASLESEASVQISEQSLTGSGDLQHFVDTKPEIVEDDGVLPRETEQLLDGDKASLEVLSKISGQASTHRGAAQNLVDSKLEEVMEDEDLQPKIPPKTEEPLDGADTLHPAPNKASFEFEASGQISGQSLTDSGDVQPFVDTKPEIVEDKGVLPRETEQLLDGDKASLEVLSKISGQASTRRGAAQNLVDSKLEEVMEDEDLQPKIPPKTEEPLDGADTLHPAPNKASFEFEASGQISGQSLTDSGDVQPFVDTKPEIVEDKGVLPRETEQLLDGDKTSLDVLSKISRQTLTHTGEAQNLVDSKLEEVMEDEDLQPKIPPKTEEPLDSADTLHPAPNKASFEFEASGQISGQSLTDSGDVQPFVDTKPEIVEDKGVLPRETEQLLDGDKTSLEVLSKISGQTLTHTGEAQNLVDSKLEEVMEDEDLQPKIPPKTEEPLDSADTLHPAPNKASFEFEASGQISGQSLTDSGEVQPFVDTKPEIVDDKGVLPRETEQLLDGDKTSLEVLSKISGQTLTHTGEAQNLVDSKLEEVMEDEDLQPKIPPKTEEPLDSADTLHPAPNKASFEFEASGQISGQSLTDSGDVQPFVDTKPEIVEDKGVLPRETEQLLDGDKTSLEVLSKISGHTLTHTGEAQNLVDSKLEEVMEDEDLQPKIPPKTEEPLDSADTLHPAPNKASFEFEASGQISGQSLTDSGDVQPFVDTKPEIVEDKGVLPRETEQLLDGDKTSLEVLSKISGQTLTHTGEAQNLVDSKLEEVMEDEDLQPKIPPKTEEPLDSADTLHPAPNKASFEFETSVQISGENLTDSGDMQHLVDTKPEIMENEGSKPKIPLKIEELLDGQDTLKPKSVDKVNSQVSSEMSGESQIDSAHVQHLVDEKPDVAENPEVYCCNGAESLKPKTDDEINLEPEMSPAISEQSSTDFAFPKDDDVMESHGLPSELPSLESEVSADSKENYASKQKLGKGVTKHTTAERGGGDGRQIKKKGHGRRKK